MTDPANIATRYLDSLERARCCQAPRLDRRSLGRGRCVPRSIAAGEGLAGIDAVIEGVQNRFPDFRFRQIGAADGFGD